MHPPVLVLYLLVGILDGSHCPVDRSWAVIPVILVVLVEGGRESDVVEHCGHNLHFEEEYRTKGTQRWLLSSSSSWWRAEERAVFSKVVITKCGGRPKRSLKDDTRIQSNSLGVDKSCHHCREGHVVKHNRQNLHTETKEVSIL